MLGGDLVLADTPFAARDKLLHLIGFMLLWLVLQLLPWPALTRLLVWASCAIGWELFEGWRMWRWWRRTQLLRKLGWVWHWDTWTWHSRVYPPERPRPESPPRWADRPSWRDLVADAAGLVLAQGWLMLLAVIG